MCFIHSLCMPPNGAFLHAHKVLCALQSLLSHIVAKAERPLYFCVQRPVAENTQCTLRKGPHSKLVSAPPPHNAKPSDRPISSKRYRVKMPHRDVGDDDEEE